MNDNPILNLAFATGGLGILVSLARAFPISRQDGPGRLRSVAKAVRAGALAFLRREYLAVWVAVLVLALMLDRLGAWVLNGFVAGAVLAALAGYYGLVVSVEAGVRTASAAGDGVRPALAAAFKGGSAVALMSAGLGLASLAGILWLARFRQAPAADALHGLLGLALGGSLMSLAGRVAGGIYAKVADVGADQAGKSEAGLADADSRNAGAIAEQAGDHAAGAGMGADLFATYLLTLAAAMWLAQGIFGKDSRWVEFPLLIGSLSLAASIVGGFFVRTGRRPRIVGALYRGVLVSVLLAGGAFYYAADLFLALPGLQPAYDRVGLAAITAAGLALLLLIAVITEYYTTTGFAPARRVALAAATGPATNVIAGLAVGMRATILPVFAIGGVLAAAYYLGGSSGSPGTGLYAIALAAVVPASMAGTIGALAAFGTIADSAAGLAALAELPEDAGRTARTLDNAGHTVRTVAGACALVAAALASLLLLLGYARAFGLALDLADPRVPLGLLAGSLLPCWFGAHLLEAVGKGAGRVVEEVRTQLRDVPALLNGDGVPCYVRCLDTAARSFVYPSFLPVLIPLALPVAVGFGAGQQALGALLLGSLMTGLPMAIALVSSGGAWDSARRHIEEGRLGGPCSAAHRAVLAGDAVGDSAKDAVGPALGSMLRTLFLTALLIASLLS